MQDNQSALVLSHGWIATGQGLALSYSSRPDAVIPDHVRKVAFEFRRSDAQEQEGKPTAVVSIEQTMTDNQE